jgi:hypothetical protein
LCCVANQALSPRIGPPSSRIISTGVLIRFITTPSGVPRNAWQLQAIFLSTIVDHGLVQHTLNETPHPIQAVPFTTLSSSPYACIASNLPWYRRRLSLALLIM